MSILRIISQVFTLLAFTDQSTLKIVTSLFSKSSHSTPILMLLINKFLGSSEAGHHTVLLEMTPVWRSALNILRDNEIEKLA